LSSEFTIAVEGKVRAIGKRLKISLNIALLEGFRPTNHYGHQGRRGDGAFRLKSDGSLRNGLVGVLAVCELIVQSTKPARNLP
jgi:hypothetical protein